MPCQGSEKDRRRDQYWWRCPARKAKSEGDRSRKAPANAVVVDSTDVGRVSGSSAFAVVAAPPDVAADEQTMVAATRRGRPWRQSGCGAMATAVKAGVARSARSCGDAGGAGGVVEVCSTGREWRTETAAAAATANTGFADGAVADCAAGADAGSGPCSRAAGADAGGGRMKTPAWRTAAVGGGHVAPVAAATKRVRRGSRGRMVATGDAAAAAGRYRMGLRRVQADRPERPFRAIQGRTKMSSVMIGRKQGEMDPLVSSNATPCCQEQTHQQGAARGGKGMWKSMEGGKGRGEHTIAIACSRWSAGVNPHG